MSETPNKLKKNLSFFSMISIACGAVIGGWLTESPYWFELTGSSCVFVFPLLEAFCKHVAACVTSSQIGCIPLAAAHKINADGNGEDRHNDKKYIG